MENKVSREIPRAGQVAQAQVAKSALDFTYFSAELKHLGVPSGLNFLQMSHSETPGVNTLDLTRSAVLSRVKNFSSIDLTGTINNTIKLNWAAVAILSDAFDAAAKGVDSARMLVVSGNPGDAMQLVNLKSWAVAEVQSAETLSATYGHEHQFLAGHAYKAFSLYGATVFVDEVMQVNDAAVTVDAQLKSQVFSIEALFGSPAPVAESGDKAETPEPGATSASFKGVAIVFAGTGGANGDIATTGHYELSKDGGASWMSVGGDLSDATAVYADKSALLRYVGAEDAERLQPQRLMVRLIDDSGLNGSADYDSAATGSTIDVSVHGLSTAFGADALTLLARSSKPPMPIAPEQSAVGQASDGWVPEGEVGSPVSSLVGGSDGQRDKGIAITGVDNTQGTLYYSTNGGSSWTEVTRPLSESNSLFMRSDGDNRVFFKPSANLMVRSGNALTIRSWDQSEATETIFFNTTDDGLTIPEANAAWGSQVALADVSSVQDNPTDELAPAAPLNARVNPPASLDDAAVEVTPEVLAAAIATSVNSSMAKVYAMRQGDSLDLTALLSQVQAEGAAAALGALDNPAPVLHLTMADVLSLPAQNGVHQLVLSGTVNDKLMLSKDEWTDTGAVVNQDGHTYAVFAGSTDASAQLLIDQHMLQNLMSS
ncbi:hypothetical protein [Limnohabitans sp. 63ED37-2]|uniref:hypothetical protein n=1 Tax=Limnohabitans sp. 63ED37-2 TaxID=1678128 RepID=UPI00070582DB|nr:hypothetical protein [Limnohabitans sp. 63ED37-2]ALK89379.1 hypothetical protein L63ED372_02176 [Limnohabitans sp. 63ED37-2]